MRRGTRIATILAASVLAAFFIAAAWTRMRSPLSAAAEDSYAVWIALWKGFSGDVAYVGSTGTHAYFRTGRVFWSYYKIPSCLAELPRTFRVGVDSYVASREHVPSYYSEKCPPGSNETEESTR